MHVCTKYECGNGPYIEGEGGAAVSLKGAPPPISCPLVRNPKSDVTLTSLLWRSEKRGMYSSSTFYCNFPETV